MKYPNQECYKAYECGQELHLSGIAVTPEVLDKALSFCENTEEKLYLCMGFILEAADFDEVVGA